MEPLTNRESRKQPPPRKTREEMESLYHKLFLEQTVNDFKEVIPFPRTDHEADIYKKLEILLKTCVCFVSEYKALVVDAIDINSDGELRRAYHQGEK